MRDYMSQLARNTSYFTLALVLQKIISLSYFTLYARYLGAADLGLYYFAISVTSIFGIFIDFGIGNVITREVSKAPEKAKSILANVMALKLPLALITIGALVLWSTLWDYEPIVKQLIYISCITMLFDGFTNAFFAVARGFHNLKYESISSVLFQLIVLVLSLFILKEDWGIAWLMSTLALASAFNFFFAMFTVRNVWKIGPWPRWDPALIRSLVKLTLPFGMFVVVQRFYTYFDSVLLFKLAGDRAVGLYQVPFKIIIALQFLPLAFVASLYPALSSYWHNAREKLSAALEQGIKYCLLISIPLSVGAIILADQIVLLFKNDFGESAMLLRVSMLAVPFMFVGFPIGSLLNACDRQKRNTVNMTITAFLSAAINIILIPRYGVLGACITTVISSIVMLVLGVIVVPSITKLRIKTLLLMIVQVLAAATVMGILTYVLKEYLNPIVTILISAASYGVALYIFGVFSKEEIKSALRVFHKIV